ncbi:MAG: MBOAT family protein [Acidobacteriota bacterium]
MVFSSHLFLFYFLPLALILHYLLPRGLRHAALTGLSYLFYGWANPAFVVLMLASTVVDFACGLFIAGGGRLQREPPQLTPGTPRSRGQRVALILSLVSNLSLLGFFKYFDFAVGTWDSLATSLGWSGAVLDLTFRVTLPLGISFYTFQSMSYTIDVYRGDARAISRFIDFACYVSLFPQLVAGPIIRFKELDGQLRSRTCTFEKFSRGVVFLALGLGKKVLLANPCGKLADLAFDAGGRELLQAWQGILAYALQIYFDFSGYSDMAIGLGLMLGFVFPKNFDSPYRSRSITEFWRRWHLSLSTWLRDYLYVPLGGNRKGPRRTYLNLLAVMLLGGLWHGASWTFVAWGAIHGLLLAGERALGKASPWRRLPDGVQLGLTFIVVSLAWVPFRADGLGAALDYWADLFALRDLPAAAALLAGPMSAPYLVGSCVLALAVALLAPQTWDLSRRLSPPRIAWALAVFLLAVVALTTQDFNPFIYFIF